MFGHFLFLSFDFFLFDNSCSTHADLQMYSTRSSRGRFSEERGFPLATPKCRCSAALPRTSEPFSLPPVPGQLHTAVHTGTNTTFVCVSVCVCLSSLSPHHSNQLRNNFWCLPPLFSSRSFSPFLSFILYFPPSSGMIIRLLPSWIITQMTNWIWLMVRIWLWDFQDFTPAAVLTRNTLSPSNSGLQLAVGVLGAGIHAWICVCGIFPIV